MTRDPPATIRDARPEDAGPVQRLLEAEGLEAGFVPAEFLVAEDERSAPAAGHPAPSSTSDGHVIGCARVKPLSGPEGASELASVAVAPEHRGEGIGRHLVHEALEGAPEPVYALCLEPGFFAHLGFEAADAVPPSLAEKADGCCASLDPVAMVFERED